MNNFHDMELLGYNGMSKYSEWNNIKNNKNKLSYNKKTEDKNKGDINGQKETQS